MRLRTLHSVDRPSLAVAVGLAALVLAWIAQPIDGGDTGPLTAGTEQLADCLAELDLVSCEQRTPIGAYPVLQYAPDLVAHAGLRLSEGTRRALLSVLSGIGVAAAVAAAWLVLRRVGAHEWRWGFLLVVLSGPVLAYGSATWGEMLATGLLTMFVAGALLQARPWLLGVAAFAASVTKETSYPFVAALGVVALLIARRRTGEPIRRHVLAGGLGVAAALALTGAFNVLRFGTPRNAYYLDPALRTSTVPWFFELTAGLFVSPNGGILVFWPTASLLLALLLAVPVVRAFGREVSWNVAWPAPALAAIAACITLGLAAWWAPFGWWAWGPRLTLPWVLPIVLVALAAFGPMLTPWVARTLSSRPAFILVAGLLVAVALPHIGYVWRPETLSDFFFTPESAVCPGGGPPPTPAYYACLREELWTRHPIWLDALEGLKTFGGLATALGVAAAVLGSLALLRRNAIARVGRLRTVSTRRGRRARREPSGR